MVGLLCSGGNNGIAIFIQRLFDQILQFSGFIAARGQSGVVIPFNKEIIIGVLIG
jgi:hypothetical protein